MTNIISNLMQQAANACTENPYVAGGMVAGGILLVVGKWAWNKRNGKKK